MEVYKDEDLEERAAVQSFQIGCTWSGDHVRAYVHMCCAAGLQRMCPLQLGQSLISG